MLGYSKVFSILIFHCYRQLFAHSCLKLFVKYDGSVDSSLTAVFSALPPRELPGDLGFNSRLDQAFSVVRFIYLPNFLYLNQR